MDKALSTKQATEILGCCAGTVRGEIKRNRLRAFRIGGVIRIRQSQLESYRAKEIIEAMKILDLESGLVQRLRMERQERLKALLNAGKDVKEIAEDLGVNRGEVGRLMRQWRFSRSGRRPKEFKKLLNEGKSTREIAKKYGISRARVWQLKKNWGLQG